MKDPVTPLVAAMLAIAAASFSPAHAGGEAAEPASALPPIVVELFTSQGCSSCPPADVVLSVYFLGDAGAPDPRGDPVLLALARDVEPRPNR